MDNRIIKFRAWTDLGLMIEPYCELKPEDDNSFWAEDRTNPPYNYCSVLAVMQFTGKVDSHGNEIYDQDILRVTEEGEFGDENHYFIVTWIHEWCMFAALDHTEYNGYLAKGIKAIDETMFWTYNLEESEQFTICGNVLQNPDYIMNAHKEEEDTMHDVIGDLPD